MGLIFIGINFLCLPIFQLLRIIELKETQKEEKEVEVQEKFDEEFSFKKEKKESTLLPRIALAKKICFAFLFLDIIAAFISFGLGIWLR